MRFISLTKWRHKVRDLSCKRESLIQWNNLFYSRCRPSVCRILWCRINCFLSPYILVWMCKKINERKKHESSESSHAATSIKKISMFRCSWLITIWRCCFNSARRLIFDLSFIVIHRPWSSRNEELAWTIFSTVRECDPRGSCTSEKTPNRERKRRSSDAPGFFFSDGSWLSVAISSDLGRTPSVMMVLSALDRMCALPARLTRVPFGRASRLSRSRVIDWWTEWPGCIGMMSDRARRGLAVCAARVDFICRLKDGSDWDSKGERIDCEDSLAFVLFAGLIDKPPWSIPVAKGLTYLKHGSLNARIVRQNSLTEGDPAWRLEISSVVAERIVVDRDHVRWVFDGASSTKWTDR